MRPAVRAELDTPAHPRTDLLGRHHRALSPAADCSRSDKHRSPEAEALQERQGELGKMLTGVVEGQQQRPLRQRRCLLAPSQPVRGGDAGESPAAQPVKIRRIVPALSSAPNSGPVP